MNLEYQYLSNIVIPCTGVGSHYFWMGFPFAVPILHDLRPDTWTWQCLMITRCRSDGDILHGEVCGPPNIPHFLMRRDSTIFDMYFGEMPVAQIRSQNV